jgi:hypothetical protein
MQPDCSGTALVAWVGSPQHIQPDCTGCHGWGSELGTFSGETPYKVTLEYETHMKKKCNERQTQTRMKPRIAIELSMREFNIKKS